MLSNKRKPSNSLEELIDGETNKINSITNSDNAQNKEDNVQPLENSAIMQQLCNLLYNYVNVLKEIKVNEVKKEKKLKEIQSILNHKRLTKENKTLKIENLNEEIQKINISINNTKPLANTNFEALSTFFAQKIQLTEDIDEMYLSYEDEIDNNTLCQYSYYFINKWYISKEFENQLKNESEALIRDIAHFFDEFKDYNFNLLLCSSPYASMSKDIFLNCMKNYKNIEGTPLFMLIIKKIDLNHLQKENLFHKDEFEMTFEKLKDYLTSKVALQCYYLLAKTQKIFSSKIESPDEIKNLIKKEVLHILDTYTLYTASLSITNTVIAAITCSSKIIILSKSLFEKDDHYGALKYTGQNAAIIATLAHEVGHAMIRSIKNNFFLQTNSFGNIKYKDLQNIIEEEEHVENKTLIKTIKKYLSESELKDFYKHVETEAGEFVESLLTNCIWTFNIIISRFIMTRANWDTKLSEFRLFIISHSQEEDENEGTTFCVHGKAKCKNGTGGLVYYKCPYAMRIAEAKKKK